MHGPASALLKQPNAPSSTGVRPAWRVINFGDGLRAYARVDRLEDAEKVAVVDIGSHSAKMVSYGTFEYPAQSLPKSSYDLICGLGDGMSPDDPTPVLNANGLAKYYNEFLPECRTKLDDVDPDIIFVGCTEAVRAANKNPKQNDTIENFLQTTARKLGIDQQAINILTDDQEAHLAELGVIYGNPTFDGYTLTVGGNSTEISKINRGRISKKHRATLRFGVQSLAQKSTPYSYVTRQFQNVTWYKAGNGGTKANKALSLQGGTFRIAARLLAQRLYDIPLTSHVPVTGFGFANSEHFKNQIEELKTKSADEIFEECLTFQYRQIHGIGKKTEIDPKKFAKWKNDWLEEDAGKRWHRKYNNRIGQRIHYLHVALDITLAAMDHLKPHTIYFGAHSIREGALLNARRANG